MNRPIMPSLSSPIWLALIVLAGLGLRSLHYFRAPAVWHDEAALILNVVNLDFAQQLGKLLGHEAAPPAFLWTERAIVLALGDSVAMLRLLPFLASCASLIVFALLARRMLTSGAAYLAAALFAVSDRLLWHACEAKPYAVDVFIAVSVVYGNMLTRHWSLARQGLLWLFVLPVLPWLSFPACFVAGGLMLSLLPRLVREGSTRDWLAACALALATAGSFYVLVTGPIRAQQDESMVSCWVEMFPDWNKPASVPLWTLLSSLEVINYDIAPQGLLLTAFAIVGGIVWWNNGRRGLVVALAAPALLTLLAALLKRYPFGGARVLVFTAPAACLLVAAGVGPVCDWLRRQHRLAVLGVWVLLAFPFLHTAHRAIVPWDRADTASASQYVLANWQPGDRVAFNHCEFEYYFRDRDAAWVDPEQVPHTPPKRIWLVTTSKVPAEREGLLTMMASGRPLTDRRDFRHVTVALLNPNGSTWDSTSPTASLP
jgi:hypothetical protein